MKTIHVSCSKEYDIHIDYHLIDKADHLIQNLPIGNKIMIISDDIVEDLYLDQLIEQLKQNHRVFSHVILNGEASKNINSLNKILNDLAQKEFHRNDTIIALGGGVVSDLAGLCAALYMRGISFIVIPTTLLSMVDASIGGKTAIDLPYGKNLAGTFYQPSMVICDLDIIQSLPYEIFQEGMAEVIKYNVIEESRIIEYIENNTLLQNLEDVIYDCISIKTKIVEKDEYETKGLRKKLNAGHTFGHALENLSDYQISHGRAVGTGLYYEALISKQLHLCDQETVLKIRKAVEKYDLLLQFDYSFEEIVEHMKLDKKNDSDTISFVLPLRIGDCKEIRLSSNETLEILKQIGESHENS